MFNFLHNFQPSALSISIGAVNIYWYGIFIVIGIAAGLAVSLKIAKHFNTKPDDAFDLAFWMIICGLIGARFYHILLEWSYYISNPLDILKIWQGGLAIHGGIIGALLAIIIYSKKNKLSFWPIAAMFAPSLALGQAIGRWGNYFNQELFGTPTNLPWGIPIELMNRPHFYISSEYFHPTFLYESLGDLLIFGILIFLSSRLIFKARGGKITGSKIIFFSYLLMYSLLRFFLEFLRTDKTAYLFGWRWPQIISVMIFIFSAVMLLWRKKKKVEISD
jgi:phosphatidylglycerol:prolipoprotein diacylglycerol transferase